MQKYIDKGREKLHKILRWSEKYTKTDMVYVVENSFWSTVGQIFSLVLVLISSIIFSRVIPKEIYGNYKFIISATSILGSFTLSGMSAAIIQAVAKGKDGVVKTAIYTSLRWGLITFISSLVLAGYYLYNDNLSIALAIIVAGIANPLISTYGLYMSILTGKKDFRSITLYFSASQTLNTLLMITTAILIPNALALVLVGFSVNVLTYIFFYLITLDKYPLNNVDDPEMIKYGMHVSFMNAFSALANQIDKIFVFHYLGAAELAIYSFAIAIPEQMRGSYKGLFNIALPKFSAKESELKKSLWDKTKKLTVLTVLIIALYVLFAPFIYKFLFPKYLDSIVYSQVYVIALITVPGISLFSTYFSVRKETKILYWISLITNSTTIVLSYLLIKNYGLFGAVMENTISWTIMLAVNGLFFYKHKEINKIN
ncbi:MAG: oligosaccharide flippase family protein [bacterium]